MVENVMNEIKRILVTHLPVEFDKQDGHAADGIILDDVNQDNVIVGDMAPPNYGLPAIIIRAEGVTNELFATAKKNANYRITISACVTDTDQAVSLKKLWRTLRAIENALEINLPGTNSIIEYKTDGMDFHASLFSMNEEKSTEKGGIIQATVMERLDAYTSSQV